MVKSRQRDSQSQLIIHSKINWGREAVITIFTLIVWIYCFFVIAFFVSSLFNYHDSYISLIKTAFKMTNLEIRWFLYLVVGFWIIFYVGLWFWKIYNQKRFGALQRRVYPEFATKKDIMELQLMSEKDYESLFKSNVVVFVRNPISDFKRTGG